MALTEHDDLLTHVSDVTDRQAREILGVLVIQDPAGLARALNTLARWEREDTGHGPVPA